MLYSEAVFPRQDRYKFCNLSYAFRARIASKTIIDLAKQFLGELEIELSTTCRLEVNHSLPSAAFRTASTLMNFKSARREFGGLGRITILHPQFLLALQHSFVCVLRFLNKLVVIVIRTPSLSGSKAIHDEHRRKESLRACYVDNRSVSNLLHK